MYHSFIVCDTIMCRRVYGDTDDRLVQFSFGRQCALAKTSKNYLTRLCRTSQQTMIEISTRYWCFSVVVGEPREVLFSDSFD